MELEGRGQWAPVISQHEINYGFMWIENESIRYWTMGARHSRCNEKATLHLTMGDTDGYLSVTITRRFRMIPCYKIF